MLRILHIAILPEARMLARRHGDASRDTVRQHELVTPGHLK